jgi:hypothetical protein
MGSPALKHLWRIMLRGSHAGETYLDAMEYLVYDSNEFSRDSRA